MGIQMAFFLFCVSAIQLWLIWFGPHISISWVVIIWWLEGEWIEDFLLILLKLTATFLGGGTHSNQWPESTKAGASDQSFLQLLYLLSARPFSAAARARLMSNNEAKARNIQSYILSYIEMIKTLVDRKRTHQNSENYTNEICWSNNWFSIKKENMSRASGTSQWQCSVSGSGQCSLCLCLWPNVMMYSGHQYFLIYFGGQSMCSLPLVFSKLFSEWRISRFWMRAIFQWLPGIQWFMY